MAKSQLATTIQDWSRRTSTLAGMGVSPDKFSELAQKDINKVASGGTGLTDQEVYDAALSGGEGAPVIQDPTKSTSPLGILGNIVPDIGGILEGAPKGIFDLIHHAPSSAVNLGHYVANTLGRSGASEANWEQQHGYENTTAGGGMTLGDLAAGFRNVSKNPLVNSLAPGISDIASLTTSAGRKSLEQHPVGAALDIAPTLPSDVIGEAATRGLYGGEEAAHAAGLAAGEAGPAAADTWQTKLASGHPAAALIRSIEPLNDIRTAFLQRFHLDPQSLLVNRKGNEIKAATALKQKKLYNSIISVLPRDADGNIDDVTLARVTDEDVDPRLLSSSPDPEGDQALLNLMHEKDQMAQDMAKSTGQLRSVEYNGEDELFSTEGAGGEVLGAYDRMLSLENAVSLKRQELDKLQSDHVDKFGKDKTPPLPNSPKEASLKVIKGRMSGLKRLMKSLSKAQKEYQRQLHDTAPARFQPMIENDLRDQVRAKLTSSADKTTGKITDPESGLENSQVGLKEAFDDLAMGRMNRIFSNEVGWFTPEHWNDMYRQAEQTWQDMAKAGYDPQWVHVTHLDDLDSLNSAKPLSHAAKPSMVKDRTLNLQPKLSDWGAALSVAAHEYLRMRASEDYIQNVLVPQSLGPDDVFKQIEPEASRLASKAKATVSKADIKEDLIKKNYQRISSDLTGGIVTPRLKPIMDAEHYLPKHLADTTREFTNPEPLGKFARALQGGNKVYMTSVLAFNPTFVAKHLITGTVSLIGADGYRDWLPQNLAKAYHMATNADELMPIQLSQRLDTMTTDDLTSWTMGTKAGKMLEVAGKAAGFNYKIANLVMNMQRSMSYLGEESKRLAEGYTPEAAREMGLVHANKVFVDLNGMLPVERNALRTAIPFYSFTKQILRYALTYPIDHPYRASIIANLGEMEQADWKSGLPRSFMDLFFFGKGDNKSAINFATLDPYRDVGNYFTLTGLISSLNPFAQGTLSAAGLDTLSATPELYPSVTYNSDTGQLEAKRPSGGPLTFLQSIVPEVGTLDHFLQLSSSMRTLAATNSENYRRQLFSSLGIPYVPYQVNIPYSEEQAELNRYKYAQGQVSAAVKAGNIGPIKNLNMVPYLDELYTPEQLQSIINEMTGQRQLVSLPGLNAPESGKTTAPKQTAKKGAAQVGLEQAQQALDQ